MLIIIQANELQNWAYWVDHEMGGHYEIGAS
jgi:hypothetical protein